MRVKFEEMQQVIKEAFIKAGMNADKAEICANMHTASSCDGIYSHGTNRVPRFIDYVKKGWVDVNADPTIEKKDGSIAILNGNMGPGITNSLFATDLAMQMADEHGIGLVGLRNTTHWMRGGSYGLHAARKGYIAIAWTNTESVMPPWGGKTSKLGNNPFVMAMPGVDGPVMLDMAMSQYAYGKLQVTRLAGKKLPFPGGYDKDGNLTDEPGPIEESRRILPMGYWKGSSFAFMLDILAAALTNGLSGSEIDNVGKGSCGGASQVFIVINPNKFTDAKSLSEMVEKSIAHLKTTEPAEISSGILYPGEDYIMNYKDNMENGVFVDDSVWEEIKGLL